MMSQTLQDVNNSTEQPVRPWCCDVDTYLSIEKVNRLYSSLQRTNRATGGLYNDSIQLSPRGALTNNNELVFTFNIEASSNSRP